jgi:predicted DNA-binding transcriptional regulator AlpA
MSPLWKDGDKWLNATTTAALLSVSRNSLKPLMNRLIDPLPPPFPFGGSRRWLASSVWTWMERQMAGSDAPEFQNGPRVAGGDTDLSSRSDQSHPAWLAKLKLLYESGATLDELCRREKIGKARVSMLLREAGAAMRRPGRPSPRVSKQYEAASGGAAYGR